MIPSPFLASIRFRWPTALLAVSVGLIGIGIIEATRSARSQERLAQGVLRDYSRFASWSYRQHLGVAMGSALREILGAVNHGDNLHTSEKIPHARELAHYLPGNPLCACHRRELCEVVKDKKENGGKNFDALIMHVAEDSLVLWGWKPGGARVPVSVPHAEFVAKFKQWAAAGGPCPSDQRADAAAKPGNADGT